MADEFNMFNETMNPGLAGQIDGTNIEVEAAVVSDKCHAGLMRCRGTGKNQSVPPTTAAMVNRALLGGTVYLPSVYPYESLEVVDDEAVVVFYQYAPKAQADHIKRGNIRMRVEQNVTPQDPVFVRITEDPDDPTKLLGALRKDAGVDATDFEGVLIEIESAADLPYSVNVDGVEYTYAQGSAGTIGAKATGLAAEINGQAAGINGLDLAAVVESTSFVRIRYATRTDILPDVQVRTDDAALLTISEAGTLEAHEAVEITGKVSFIEPGSAGGTVRCSINLPG